MWIANRTNSDLLCACLLLLLTGCTRTPPTSTAQTNQQGQQQPTVRSSPLSEFESNLQYVRNGGYTYIWVFSRRDKKPLDKDDGAYLRKNAPQIVDWVGTDSGRRFIGGTNFNLEEGNLDLLRKRFVAEDYSSR